jgi:hypothetical protein
VSESPAARLARIRVRNPLWSIRPVRSGIGFTAHYCAGRRRLWAPDLDELEAALWRTGLGNRGPRARKTTKEHQ